MKLKEIAENHGLTPEGVDYALTQYQIVICEITHGILSKLSYDAKDIIRTAQDRWCDLCDLKEQEAVKPIERNGFYYCGACRYALMTNHQKYCSDCGKKVKWGDR